MIRRLEQGKKRRQLLQSATRSSVLRVLHTWQVVNSCRFVECVAPTSRNKRKGKRTDASLRLPHSSQNFSTRRRIIGAPIRQQPGGASENVENETDDAAIAHDHSMHNNLTHSSWITLANTIEGLCCRDQHLWSAVKKLKPGIIFAQSYKILCGSGFVHWKPLILYAQDIYSKDFVILKFFARQSQFENILKKRLRLKPSAYICKLLKPVKEPGYLPCLVFEKGDETLKEYLEKPSFTLSDRINVLRQILMGLVDVHGCGVVHFDLKPENIMWFNKDHKWKLLDFGSSASVGSFSHECVTPSYAAPEIARAAERGPKITVKTSADLWSFGKIASEVLAGQRLFGPNSTIDEVTTFLDSSWKSTVVDVDCERQARKLISKLLITEPDRRITASEALDQALFRPADTTSKIISRSIKGGSHNIEVIVPSQTALTEGKQAELGFSFKMGYFEKSNSLSDPLLVRDGCEVPVALHCEQKRYPVFLLRAGEEGYCLRITLTQGSKTKFCFKRIVEENVLDDDASKGQLDIVQWKVNEMASELIAYLRPRMTSSDDHSMQFDFVLLFGTDEDTHHALSLRYRIYCRFSLSHFPPRMLHRG